MFTYGNWSSHLEVLPEYKQFVYIIHLTKDNVSYSYIGYKKINKGWENYFQQSPTVKSMKEYIVKMSILKFFETEDGGCEYERYLQKKYRVLNNSHWLNKNIGGSSYIYSDIDYESIQLLKCKECIIDGVKFTSVKEASEQLCIKYQTLTTRLNQNLIEYENYRYTDDEREYREKDTNSIKLANQKKVLIDNVYFESIADASIKLNIKYSTLKYRIYSGVYGKQDGIEVIEKGPSKNLRRCIFNGKEYDQIQSIQIDTNKPIEYIKDMLYTNTSLYRFIDKQNTEKVISYFNKQYPSIDILLMNEDIKFQRLKYLLKTSKDNVFYIKENK